jgi:hypothetical protein
VYSISLLMAYKFLISLCAGLGFAISAGRWTGPQVAIFGDMDARTESPTLPACCRRSSFHFVSRLPGAINSNPDWAPLPPVRQGKKPS